LLDWGDGFLFFPDTARSSRSCAFFFFPSVRNDLYGVISGDSIVPNAAVMGTSPPSLFFPPPLFLTARRKENEEIRLEPRFYPLPFPPGSYERTFLWRRFLFSFFAFGRFIAATPPPFFLRTYIYVPSSCVFFLLLSFSYWVEARTVPPFPFFGPRLFPPTSTRSDGSPFFFYYRDANAPFLFLSSASPSSLSPMTASMFILSA